MQNKILQVSLIVGFLALNTACNGGGSGGNGGGEPGDNFPGTGEGESSLELSWEVPTLREDETLLPPEEIQGYVVVGFAENRAEEFVNQLENSYTLGDYRDNPSVIKSFITPSDVYFLVKAGVGNAVVIPSVSQTTLLLEDVPADTYHFAITAVDNENQVSSLSQTVEITVSE